MKNFLIFLIAFLLLSSGISEAKTELININGVNISVKESGQGSPIILIHGKGYSKEYMDSLFNYYAEKYHVFSYDTRGHGQSSKPEFFTLDDNADDLAALIKYYGLNKPVIIGFSMGSYITLTAAEKYPDLFSKIILIGTRGKGDSYPPERISEAKDKNDLAITRSLINFDLMTNIKKVRVPALVITGENDSINPPNEAKKVAEALSDSKFEIIPNAPHVAFMKEDGRKLVLKYIDEFLGDGEKILTENVKIKSGFIRGLPRNSEGVLNFRGIPYAQPPVGELRWRAPQPVKSWEGVRDATKFGNRALSALDNDLQKGSKRSEDCLYLNVWTSAKNSSEKLPVMVWIHGGGFQFGSGEEPVYNGNNLAQKGVIIVTFNYRLGVMGFFAHPELDKEGASGNYGLQDQIAALQWVKENISAFGGDPDNITLFGESAGAMSIGILMTSPLAISQKLFHKAICESGALWDGRYGPLESFEEAHKRGVDFMKKMGAKSIAELRAMSGEKLNNASKWTFQTNPIVTVFSPNVDNYVIKEFPGGVFYRGQQMQIPLLAGWQAAEYYPFQAFNLPHKNAEEFKSAASKMFGADRMQEFLKIYPANNDEQANISANELTSDFTISEQTWYLLEQQSKFNNIPVYGYEFSYTSPYVPIASHISDLQFVFGNMTRQYVVNSDNPPEKEDYELSEIIMSYWTNFAKNSNPNDKNKNLPEWPDYRSQKIMDLGKIIQAESNPRLERFKFIESFRINGVYPLRWRKDAKKK